MIAFWGKGIARQAYEKMMQNFQISFFLNKIRPKGLVGCANLNVSNVYFCIMLKLCLFFRDLIARTESQL